MRKLKLLAQTFVDGFIAGTNQESHAFVCGIKPLGYAKKLNS
jgi:hypothetical protein